MTDRQLDNILQQTPELPLALGAKIRAEIRQGGPPEKLMMSGLAYSVLIVGVSAAVAMMWAAALGFYGLRVLPPALALEMVCLLLIATCWAGAMVSRSMRPGSGNLYSVLLALTSWLGFEALVLSGLGDYSLTGFVHNGLVCLTIGLLCACFASIPIWMIVRRGFIVQRMRAGAVMGLVCGLAGLTALTLHCNLATVPHVGAWHASVLVICVAAGALMGRIRI